MSFLNDYLFYNSGNECPRNYHIWTALAVLSCAASRKVYLDHSYFRYYPNIYVCLVGEQGGRKTAAKDIGYELLREVMPTLPVSAESTSKEMLTKFMAAPEQLRIFRDKSGAPIEYRPLAIVSTELKNFLSINPIAMIDWITTIYDRKFYDVKTKNQGCDDILNPYVVFLSCETPEWIVLRLKEAVISGGFSRRMIWVYETEWKRIAIPEIPPGGLVAWNRVKIRLKEITEIVGEFKMTDACRKYYVDWYEALKSPSDPLMKGWYNDKHVKAFKVSMLLSLCEGNDLIIDTPHFAGAIQLLDLIEPNMAKLSSGVGRNVLAPHIQKMLDIIRSSPEGILPEKKLMQIMSPNMNTDEFYGALKYLRETDQIKDGKMKIGEIERNVVMTPEAYAKVLAAQAERAKTQTEKKNE